MLVYLNFAKKLFDVFKLTYCWLEDINGCRYAAWQFTTPIISQLVEVKEKTYTRQQMGVIFIA
jgi:hypothetical protein